MSTSLLGLVGKWLSIIFVSFLSLFHVNNKELKEFNIENENLKKDISVYSKVVPYTTVVRYDGTLDSKVKKVTTKGVDGLVYNSEGSNVVIRSMRPQVITKGIKVNEPIKKQKVNENTTVLTGKLSGYGPDCKGCSGTGNLACRTQNGSKFNLVKNGIYYNDSTYGNIRILSGPMNFPCGTVIKITKNKKSYYGIVLDYGGTMTSEWKKGRVWLDLAYQKASDSGKDGLLGSNIQFEIKRWGWK